LVVAGVKWIGDVPVLCNLPGIAHQRCARGSRKLTSHRSYGVTLFAVEFERCVQHPHGLVHMSLIHDACDAYLRRGNHLYVDRRV
jgi:hypothetical protein